MWFVKQAARIGDVDPVGYKRRRERRWLEAVTSLEQRKLAGVLQIIPLIENYGGNGFAKQKNDIGGI